MSIPSTPVIAEHSFLTLHYRLSSMADEDIVTTFHDSPATLQLGQGQLAPFLEQKLLGLPEGARQVFELSPDEAFGLRNDDLIQAVSLATLKENAPLDETFAVGDMVEFAAPGGGRFAGILRELRDDCAIFDFNHPLAGQRVKFEVQVIGVL